MYDESIRALTSLSSELYSFINDSIFPKSDEVNSSFDDGKASTFATNSSACF